MVKRFFFCVFVAALPATIVSAQSSMSNPIPANDGKQMFVSYCAPCHGVDGRGHGPTAAALKSPPADLSQLAKNNHGVYPAAHVMAVMDFGAAVPAHGTEEMPIWGPLLERVGHPTTSSPTNRAMRIDSLVKYIETLQTK